VLLLLALQLVAASSPRAEAPPKFVGKWGSNGTLESQFDTPGGVAVDAAGNVYVSDTSNHRI
jgi:DNA-binding beta-propeller fold protein YncE